MEQLHNSSPPPFFYKFLILVNEFPAFSLVHHRQVISEQPFFLPYEEMKCHVKCQAVQTFSLGGKRFEKVFHKRMAKKISSDYRR